MRRYFVRSDEEHSAAMASISSNMNSTTALHVLEQHEQATPALVQLARHLVMTESKRHHKTFLQGAAKKPNRLWWLSACAGTPQ
jgi:hypothetical protein